MSNKKKRPRLKRNIVGKIKLPQDLIDRENEYRKSIGMESFEVSQKKQAKISYEESGLDLKMPDMDKFHKDRQKENEEPPSDLMNNPSYKQLYDKDKSDNADDWSRSDDPDTYCRDPEDFTYGGLKGEEAWAAYNNTN